MPTRRDVLRTMGAAAAVGYVGRLEAAPAPSLGIAYTSYAVRLARGKGALGLSAEGFIDLSQAAGARGCQIADTQLASLEPDYLRKLRASLEAKWLFAELAIRSEALEDDEAFDRMAAVAKELGITRLRAALLSGRRYETFKTMAEWRVFVDRWQSALPKAAPRLEKHGLLLGIENHKDWLAADLAETLRKIASPNLGVCVDFGNNVALLEDPLEVVRTLAPFVVTTHLKDVAVRRYDHGFELAEVPLGTGFLPLREIVQVLRKSRPDVHFCLEMLTRDPLKVPYLDDGYWPTYEKRDPEHVRRFEAGVLRHSAAAPLPTISGLGDEGKIAAEDSHIRLSMEYAKKTLGL